MGEPNKLLAAALAYAGLDWAVHPLRPGDKRPLLADWPHRAATDQATIRDWRSHWVRAQTIAERWRLYTHRLYEQVTELDVSPQAELEHKIVGALRRWQGTEQYPSGMSAREIARFLRVLGTVEVKHQADQLVAANVLDRRKSGRAERYCVPLAEPRSGDGRQRRRVDGGPNGYGSSGGRQDGKRRPQTTQTRRQWPKTSAVRLGDGRMESADRRQRRRADSGPKRLRFVRGTAGWKAQTKRGSVCASALSAVCVSSWMARGLDLRTERVMAMKPIRRVYPERPRRRPKVVRRTLPPVPAPEPPLAACPAAAEPWEGLQVKIEDLPAFRARWGLVSVRGKWPDDEPCPRLDLREGRNH